MGRDILGTLNFMSPELLQNLEYNYKVILFWNILNNKIFTY